MRHLLWLKEMDTRFLPDSTGLVGEAPVVLYFIVGLLFSIILDTPRVKTGLCHLLNDHYITVQFLRC